MSGDNSFDSDTVNITSIFDWPRADLLNEKDEPILIKGQIKCSEIGIATIEVNVNALIDSGSKITYVSREFFEHHSLVFKTCPKFPIVGLKAECFLGDKSVKLGTLF